MVKLLRWRNAKTLVPVHEGLLPNLFENFGSYELSCHVSCCVFLTWADYFLQQMLTFKVEIWKDLWEEEEIGRHSPKIRIVKGLYLEVYSSQSSLFKQFEKDFTSIRLLHDFLLNCLITGPPSQRRLSLKTCVKIKTSLARRNSKAIYNGLLFCYKQIRNSWAVVMAQLVERSPPNTRDLQFEFRHRQTFIKHLFTVNCVEKTKIKKKRSGMAN